MKKASIDIGSNTILLYVGETDGSRVKELADESRVTALGRNLDENKAFDERAMEDSLEALREYRKIIDGHGISPAEVVATATAASRVADNAASFFDTVERDFGFSVRTITPRGEGYYTLQGVGLGLGEKSEEEVIFVDIGGASTELARGFVGNPAGKDFHCVSLPCGAVRSQSWDERKMEEVLRPLVAEKVNFSEKTVVGVAGTMTSLMAMSLGMEDFDPKKVHNQFLGCGEIQTLLEEAENLDPDSLKKKYPFLGKRAETIETGGKIALAIGRALKLEAFQVSTFGLRHGTLLAGKIEENFCIRK